MDIVIRLLQESDHAQAAQLFYEVFGPAGRGEAWTPETSKQFIKENTWSSKYIFCAEKHGEIVGILIAFPLTRERGPALYIDVIAVKDSEQQRGIGQALWNKVIDAAKVNKLTGIWLLATKQYPSYDWYTRMGLTESGYIEMSKELEID